MSARKRCVVAYASAHQQYLWPLELPAAANIQQALEAARAQIGESVDGAPIPWDSAAVGIFGELRTRSQACQDGDRIELYRLLAGDPRARRRAQVERARRARR